MWIKYAFVPSRSMPPENDVDEYIRAAPAGTRAVLTRVRSAIRAAAPDAEESISYGMAFYSYKGETGIDRRLCYLGHRGRSVVFYFRPMDLEPHAKELAAYRSAKSALRFSVDQPIPIPLIKKLVRSAERRHRARRGK